MRHDIPDFLWKIGTKVENLIQQHDALEYWRDHVRRWAPAENSPTDLVKTLYSRSLDAKYARCSPRFTIFALTPIRHRPSTRGRRVCRLKSHNQESVI